MRWIINRHWLQNSNLFSINHRLFQPFVTIRPTPSRLFMKSATLFAFSICRQLWLRCFCSRKRTTTYIDVFIAGATVKATKYCCYFMRHKSSLMVLRIHSPISAGQFPFSICIIFTICWVFTASTRQMWWTLFILIFTSKFFSLYYYIRSTFV